MSGLDECRRGYASLLRAAVQKQYPDATTEKEGVLPDQSFFVDTDATLSDKDLSTLAKTMQALMKAPNLHPDAFTLFSISGAYRKGDENEAMLTRIRGWGAPTPKELKTLLEEKAESATADHRTLGKKLGLFTFSNTVGKGLPLYTEKGAAIKRVLERLVVDEEIKRGYQHVSTPDLTNVALYEKSGHLEHYRDSMYAPIDIDDEQFMLRPMTCPHHFELYLSKPHSYRELPIRIAELSKLYRYEKSGELLGLTRVRSFCLSDAHIICTDTKQAKEELASVLQFIEDINGLLGFTLKEDYQYRLSLGDRNNTKKYSDNKKAWDESEKILREVLQERDAPFVEAPNEAAFYGPKIDIQMKTVTGKEETAFTVQYDFVMPERFDLSYIGDDGKTYRPIVIHRSSIGAIERVLAFLIEKYKGAFPFWLAPVQIRVIPLHEKHLPYARGIHADLIAQGIRAEIDIASDTIGKKIYQAKNDLLPYYIVVGSAEEANTTVALEDRDGNKTSLSIKECVQRLAKENDPYYTLNI